MSSDYFLVQHWKSQKNISVHMLIRTTCLLSSVFILGQEAQSELIFCVNDCLTLKKYDGINANRGNVLGSHIYNRNGCKCQER